MNRDPVQSFVTAGIMDQLGVDQALVPRWGE